MAQPLAHLGSSAATRRNHPLDPDNLFMTSLLAARPVRTAGFLAALVLFALPAHAQGLGGLIKKKIDKATAKDPAQQAADAPVVFDKVTLEITQERIEKLTAAKRAVRKFAE